MNCLSQLNNPHGLIQHHNYYHYHSFYVYRTSTYGKIRILCFSIYRRIRHMVLSTRHIEKHPKNYLKVVCCMLLNTSPDVKQTKNRHKSFSSVADIPTYTKRQKCTNKLPEFSIKFMIFY